jgi:hypothetical protein
MTDDYLVTVCASCLTASCWHYVFVCSNYQTAGIRDIPASELRKLGKEHPDNYSREEILRVCGAVREVA